MKQKSQNRFLAALLAVAMMLQMLPMLAFAEDAPDAHAVKIDGKEGSYAKLEDAVRAASSGDTIILGEGNYTLYKISSEGMTKGKNLTFVGQGLTKRPGISVLRCRTRSIMAQSITAITALMVPEQSPSKI